MQKIILFLTGALLMLSCQQNKSFIPYVTVNVVLNTQDPKFQALNGVGGWAYAEGGSKGLIIFRTDIDKFMAYDRHCTYQSSSSCSKVSVDNNNIFAVDTCCNSKFQLIDGNPVSGPAAKGLQQYNTTYDGNIIQISN